MIPKIIHYCWFGHNPKSKLIIKCINSWKKYQPSYKIIEWNESNYDMNTAPQYVKQAYEQKKWAFVSDYVRFDILYKQGGIYFDTDVELIKPIDDLIEAGQFMACERAAIFDENGDEQQGITIATGLGVALESGNYLCGKILNLYSQQNFVLDNGEHSKLTVVDIVTNILKENGLKNTNEIQVVSGITIYPKDYFCPKSWEDGTYKKTKNTYAIHHYAASWWSEERIKHQKKSIKNQQRYRIKDFVVHLPNRMLISIVGEKRYSRFKAHIKKGR